MLEIAPNIFIETGYAGVTLGAINWQHGLILIDAPFRAEDARSWRTALLNLNRGVDRILVNMDAHFDRTLGSRAMDCTICGHDKLVQVFHNRPVNFKPQISNTGAEWETQNGLGTIRWMPPEITFTEKLEVRWSTSMLVLEYHPGSGLGAIWADIHKEGILFLGDAVSLDQPPFLANSDLPVWIESLHLLLSPQYRNYLLVSGRGGLITHEHVREQLHFLENAHQMLLNLAEQRCRPDETEKLVPSLMGQYRKLGDRKALFTQRVRWGLHQYYIRHFYPGSHNLVEEE
jgi:hypothetical protein